MARRTGMLRRLAFGILRGGVLAVEPFAIGVALAAAPAGDLIPLAGEGIERIGACELYSGDNLYDYIDGGAPQYLEYGFREAASQELRFHGRTYILDVYRMNDAVAAFGIFSTRRPDLPATLPGFPRSCFAGYQGLVVQGPYYLEVQADKNTDSTAFDMSRLSTLAFEQAKADGSRDGASIDSVLAPLPPEDRVAGSARIARGPVSLGAAFGLSTGGTFLRVVEVVERRLAAVGPKTGVLWLVAGYHPSASSGAPRTTLACLAHVSALPELLKAIQESGYITSEAQTSGNGSGWIVPDPSGRCWAAASRGDDLLLAVSQVPADSLRRWMEQIRRR